MQTDRSASDIVELIILLAHKMNLKAIADGIETARQLERLIELGCEYGQGYFFSQPMEAKAALIFIQLAVSGGEEDCGRGVTGLVNTPVRTYAPHKLHGSSARKKRPLRMTGPTCGRFRGTLRGRILSRG
jgi:hypothetical protein